MIIKEEKSKINSENSTIIEDNLKEQKNNAEIANNDEESYELHELQNIEPMQIENENGILKIIINNFFFLENDELGDDFLSKQNQNDLPSKLVFFFFFFY